MSRHGRQEHARLGPQELDRRDFLKRAGLTLAGLSALSAGALALTGCGARGNASAPNNSSAVASSAAVPSSDHPPPKNISWQAVFVGEGEPGEPLVVSGRIFKADGKTPLAGAVLYAYHTDARGLYSDQDGNGQPPNPRLKGWMRTDAEGRYEFRTIKAAPYPGGMNPAHIHASVTPDGQAERWVDEYWFADDSLVTKVMRARYAGRGTFSPILTLTRDRDGVLRGVRDIRLE